MYKDQKFLSEQCVHYCIWLEDDSKDNLPEKETLLVCYAKRVSCPDDVKQLIKSSHQRNCIFLSLHGDWIGVMF